MDDNKIGHHISGPFNDELQDICRKVLIMGGLVELQIAQAVEAFSTGDMDLAELVIKQDNQVDALELAIDKECVLVLAQRQPTAFDLRLLLTAMKIIHELESIGDKAVCIAQMAIRVAGIECKFSQDGLENMAELVKEMLHDTLDAFARMSLENVPTITDQDDEIYREYSNVLRQLIARMMEDPRNINLTLDVLWTARALESMGDHACYICEHLIFMIKGDEVRHLSHSELKKAVWGNSS
jgi:phosphate transport system protein